MTKWLLSLTILPIVASLPLVSCSTNNDDEALVIHQSLEEAQKSIQEEATTNPLDIINEIRARINELEQEGSLKYWYKIKSLNHDMSWETNWYTSLIENKKEYDVWKIDVPGYTITLTYEILVRGTNEVVEEKTVTKKFEAKSYTLNVKNDNKDNPSIQ
ncbi:MAG: hypothetical protein ACRCXE_01680 [Metamycoplasmataceae bacterium]